MNLVHLHPGPDTGGQSVAAKRVLEARGDSVRVFVHRQHPFGYESAELWEPDLVEEAVRQADVVVVHNDPTILDRVNAKAPMTVIHHHGTRFRTNPNEVWAQGVERKVDLQVVSTIDLLLEVPAGHHAEWMPQVVDTRRIEALAEACRPDPDARIIISHAPTNRMVKGTRWVNQTMRTLRKQVDYVLIANQPWIVCLTLKASSHIFIDQLVLGYGNNAIEAWAMRLPVVAGASHPIITRMRQEFGSLPFVEVKPVNLTDTVRELMASREMRQEWGERGREHIDRYHVPDAWAKRTSALYEGRLASAA